MPVISIWPISYNRSYLVGNGSSMEFQFWCPVRTLLILLNLKYYLHFHNCMLNNNNWYLKASYSPLLLREKVCAVSPSLIISPVDSASSPSQEGPSTSDDKEHLKEFPHSLRAPPDHRGPFLCGPCKLLKQPACGFLIAHCYVQKRDTHSLLHLPLLAAYLFWLMYVQWQQLGIKCRGGHIEW